MRAKLVTIAILTWICVTSNVHARPDTAGFRSGKLADGTEVGVWYPANGTPTSQRLGLHAHDIAQDAKPIGERLPLIVMSHGTGGSLAGHADTAVELARAGFVVAALTHPGDNWQDNSQATQVEERPKALSALITYMIEQSPERTLIDPERIGAFGFSAGGFTVLATAGGRPDLSRIRSYCEKHATVFVCRTLQAHPRQKEGAWPSIQDTRLKALVVAAPALGFTYDRSRLADVTMPIQLWRADEDTILPAPDYADAVREALPSPPEFHTVPGAGHFDFLAPCVDPASVPQICVSRPGFDRRAFHKTFNAEVVRFFKAKLVPGQSN